MEPKRKPSIHITLNNLNAILGELINDDYITLNETNLVELGQLILKKSATLSLSHRVMSVKNQVLDKKAEKIKANTRSNTSLFAELLLLTRRKLKHRNVQLIKVGSNDYLLLKEISKLATEFCNEFGFGLKEGYLKYIEWHFKLLNNRMFRLNSMQNYHATIINTYEAIQRIEQDTYSDLTESAHSKYLSLISDRIGFAEGFKDNPTEYCYFIDMVTECQKLGIKPNIWIEAQFDGFDWVSAIPSPSQLVGYKAKQRVQKYCFKKNIRITNKEKRVDFSKIKRKHDTDYSN